MTHSIGTPGRLMESELVLLTSPVYKCYVNQGHVDDPEIPEHILRASPGGRPPETELNPYEVVQVRYYRDPDSLDLHVIWSLSWNYASPQPPGQPTGVCKRYHLVRKDPYVSDRKIKWKPFGLARRSDNSDCTATETTPTILELPMHSREAALLDERRELTRFILRETGWYYNLDGTITQEPKDAATAAATRTTSGPHTSTSARVMAGASAGEAGGGEGDIATSGGFMISSEVLAALKARQSGHMSTDGEGITDFHELLEQKTRDLRGERDRRTIFVQDLPLHIRGAQVRALAEEYGKLETGKSIFPFKDDEGKFNGRVKIVYAKEKYIPGALAGFNSKFLEHQKIRARLWESSS